MIPSNTTFLRFQQTLLLQEIVSNSVDQGQSMTADSSASSDAAASEEPENEEPKSALQYWQEQGRLISQNIIVPPCLSSNNVAVEVRKDPQPLSLNQIIAAVASSVPVMFGE